MSRISIKLKLSIVYTIIAVVTYLLANMYVVKLVGDKTTEKTAAQMDSIVYCVERMAEPYSLKPKTAPKSEKVYLKPGIYDDKSDDVSTEPLKYAGVPESILDSVFEDVIFKPEVHYIYIRDSEGEFVLKSENLSDTLLPVLPPVKTIFNHTGDSLLHRYGSGLSGEFYFSREITGSKDEFCIKRKAEFKGEEVFYYFKRSNNLLVTIVAPEQYFTYPPEGFHSTVLSFLPVVFIVILISGILFINYALNPIDKITEAANKITIDNIHERLPGLRAKDELSRLTETLNAMLDRLEVSFNEVKRFTSDASHELKTPLTILRGELELALNRDEDRQDYIMTIASSLDEVIRLQNVVESLLELSRADLGRAQINPSRKSLSRLVADIAEDAAILAEEKQLSVYAKIEPDVNFLFDSVRMHQAIINLTDNAIKYNRKGGSINIGMWTVDENVYIRISDTGLGIPENMVEHIFDRFFRVEASRTEQGAGLGLSIVKWIVDAHNGKISVSSTPGKGTEFEIRIPMKNENLYHIYLEDKAAKERAAKNIEKQEDTRGARR